MLFKFFISLITNETKHRFVFTGHFHVSFSKMLSYPLPIFYFFFAIIGYRSYLYIMANLLAYMWKYVHGEILNSLWLTSSLP